MSQALEDSWLARHSLLSSLALVVIVYIIVRAARKHRQHVTDTKFAALHGCEPPPTLQYRWPFALDLLIRAFRKARSGHILQLFEELIEETGTTFEQVLIGERGIDTIDPENLEAVLSTQFRDFGLGVRRETFFPLLGDGIFTQDGEAWKHSRALLRPQFLSNRAQNFSEVKKHVEDLIACIPDDGTPVDLQPLFFRFTLNTTMFLLFGRSIDSLKMQSSADGPDTSFADNFNLAQDYLARRGRLGGLYWLIGGSEFKQACKSVHSFLDGIIHKALGTVDLPDSSETNESNYVLLDELIEETRDPVILRSQLLNVLLAGRDTTACSLSWAFRLLSRSPDALQKLRAEIVSVVGDAPPTQADLKKMRYLNLVLKEVLRLYPSVPVNSRMALRTTTLPVGGGADGKSPILVRRGEGVGYCVYAMHRRRDIYGQDADAFRPERWEGGLEKRVGWAYLPFNGGPRICLGQEFALLEAGYAIVRILQEFPEMAASGPTGCTGQAEGVAHVDDTKTGSETQTLTLVLSSAEGCWVEMRRGA